MVTFKMHSSGRLAPSVITFLAGPTDSMLISPERGGSSSSLRKGPEEKPSVYSPPHSPPLPQTGQKLVRCPGRPSRPRKFREGSEDRRRQGSESLSPLPRLGCTVCPLGSTSVPA